MELRHQLIANEIAIAREVLGTNNVSTIAEELRYTPVLMINALHAGVRAGKLKYDEKRGTVDIQEEVEVEKLALSEDFYDAGNGINLMEEIEQLILNVNQSEKDVSAEELMTWLPGSTDTKIKMIAFTSGKLTTYELTDPKDKKSTYTFLTLKENADKQYGKKQFKKKK